MKLNIGCGNVPIKGYTNVDKYYYPGSTNSLLDKALAGIWNEQNPDSPWLYGDMVDLGFKSDVFDEVMLVHVLEHGSMEAGNLAIKEAHRVLKPGGRIEIEVPDLGVACALLPHAKVDSQFWYRVMGLLHGTSGADGEGQFHLCGYTKDFLIYKLKERGFIEIEEIPVGFGHGIANEKGHAEPEWDFRMKAKKP